MCQKQTLAINRDPRLQYFEVTGNLGIVLYCAFFPLKLHCASCCASLCANWGTLRPDSVTKVQTPATSWPFLDQRALKSPICVFQSSQIFWCRYRWGCPKHRATVFTRYFGANRGAGLTLLGVELSDLRGKTVMSNAFQWQYVRFNSEESHQGVWRFTTIISGAQFVCTSKRTSQTQMKTGMWQHRNQYDTWWGDDNFDDVDALVVCRQLGFSTGRSLGTSEA